MRSRFLLLVVVSLALVALMGGTAFADTAADNAQCLTCHGPGGGVSLQVDFGVGTVDRATACNKCHWITNHPYHFAESQCGGTCHKAWFKPTRTTFYQSVVAVGSSYFTTAASYDASAETLHAIHTKRTWIAEATEYRPACATCHAAASCEACHDSTVAHGQHGVAGDPAVGNPTVPVTTNTAPGVASGTYDLINRSVTAENACAAAACHGAPEVHGRVDDVDPAVTYTGTWTTAVNAGYLGGSLTSTTEAGASFEATFEGTGFAWIGGREFNGGIAAVYVDDVQVATVDTYNTPWGFGRTVYWTGGLPAGTHTLKVVNTGTKHPSSTGTKVSIQQLDFRAEGAFQPVPSCSSCHFTFAEHYDGTAHQSTTLVGCSGEGCHDTPDLLSVHTQRNAAFGCGGCHDSVRTDVQSSIAAGLTGCSDCHGSISALTGHRDAHAANPPLADADGTPNYSYYTGSIGTAPTGDCKGCHTSNLVDEHLGLYLSGWVTFPRYDSTGAAFTCGTCHDQPVGSTVQDAIAASKSACESCHTVHGPMQAVHTSTFVDGAAVPCADCHSANLAVEHNGTYTSTAGLSGCDVCHELYNGMTSGAVTGSDTQSAISMANDTRCSACHTAYHTDTTAHQATSTASKACAVCHTEGGASTIDVTAIHADAALGACKVCHANTARVPDISAKTAECASCHAAEGTDYHRNMAVHTAPESGCSVTGCHHANRDVTVVHEAGCTTCHDGSALPTTTACDNCHVTVVEDYHYDFDVDHTPTDAYSTGCAECHDTTDVRSLHVTKSCDQCHFINGCSDCHAVHMGDIGLTRPAGCATCHDTEGSDYHSSMSTAHTYDGMGESCKSCHAQTLPEAHAGYLDRYPAYADTCALCHKNADPDRIDWSTASADCSSCHEVHGDVGVLHTSTASQGCVRCHDSGDVRLVHATTAGDPDTSCDVCHNAAFDLTADMTAECETCHNAGGVPYHDEMDGLHAFGTMGSGCQMAGCHVNTLPEEHTKYLSRYPSYTDTCALCHLNGDPGRIDWSTASADCMTCHDGHGDIDVIHTATASQACADCHETQNTLDVHLKDDGSGDTDCALCHSAPAGRINWDPATVSMECAYCHGNYTQIDPGHYPLVSHDATAQTGCGQCHYKDMKAEHFRVTVSPAVTCVSCHELKVDAFTAPWDKTCGSCHPTNHGERNAKHVSTTTTCGGTGCHDISDVSDIHKALSGGGCGACHVSPASRATTTTCTAAGCHANVGTNHHEAHNAASVNPSGCSSCHFMYLDDEHAALGLTCATCHDSTVPAVAGAIAAGDLKCKSCHPAAHQHLDYEFNPNMAGGHRATADLPAMSSAFKVNGTTYTWTLPTASSFLKTGWTTSSIVPCEGCHSYSGATGPHGATMKVNIDPAYPTNWKTAYLGGSTTGVICYKCHTNLTNSNEVHREGDHHDSRNGQCIACHIQVPHGYGRPRLLGTTSDPAPYTSTRLYALQLKSYTPSGWTESNCYAGCEDHGSRVSLAWPVTGTTPITTGTITGTVRNAATNAIISGAVVTVGSKTATTSSTGVYTIADVPAGAQTVVITAAGYSDWSGTATVTAGGTVTLNASLTALPGAVSGTVTKTGGAAVASATVSIAGKTATTASNGTYSITGITAGTYTMTVSATGYSNWSGSVVITAGGTTTQNVTLTAVSTPTNLARTGASTASSQYSSTYGAAQATDGNTSTYWRSSSTGNQWLRSDLGSAKTITSVVVNWNSSYYARSYRIETSNDGTNWTQQYSTYSGNGSIDTITLSSVSARYVRVYCTSAYGSSYRINEFEVWGY